MSVTMTLLKHVDNPSLLLPYEQVYIQLFHHHNHLIQEQEPNEHNTMFQLLYNNYKAPQPQWYNFNHPHQTSLPPTWTTHVYKHKQSINKPAHDTATNTGMHRLYKTSLLPTITIHCN
jgi:hypothetical protein